jgi:hypothetical protein
MSNKSRHEDEINIAFTKDLIGDVYVTTLGILSSAWLHLSDLFLVSRCLRFQMYGLTLVCH